MCTQTFFIYPLTKREVLWQSCEMNELTPQGAPNEKHPNWSGLINKPAWSLELCFLQISWSLVLIRTQSDNYVSAGVFCSVNKNEMQARQRESTLNQWWVSLKTEHLHILIKSGFNIFAGFPLNKVVLPKRGFHQSNIMFLNYLRLIMV